MMLKAAFLADYVMLGGGHSKKLDELPEGCRRGSNEMAYLGGVKMWEGETDATNSDATLTMTQANSEKLRWVN